LINKLTKYGFSGLRIFVTIVLLLSLAAIIVVSYFLYKQNEPVNYFMNEDRQNYKILPTNTPILQVDRVKQWTTASIAIIFTFDFINYQKAMNVNRNYFTDAGWKSFQQAIENNGLKSDVLNKNLILNSNVCDLPVLANREQDPKAFYLSSKWRFTVPIIVNIQGASGVTRNSVYIVEADVRFLTDHDISLKNNRQGGEASILGIDALKMKSANFTNYCRIPF